MMLWSLVVVAWRLMLLPPSSAFLPTMLNYSDPDVVPFFCPDQMTGKTWDHKAITREAFRREVRRFFLENPPTNESFTIPEDASLSQVFRAYYGPISSPARFMKAVSNIAWSNAMTETSGQLRYEAAYHMDGESILEGHTLLQDRYQQLIRTIMADETYDFARELLGTSLNGIQDFYSQTTWVELGNTEVLEGLGLPGMAIGEVAGPNDPTCTNCDHTEGSCDNNLIPSSKLTSGYYEYTVTGAESFVKPKPDGVGKCSHGGSMDSSRTKEATGGINKESTSPCFSPHHHLHQQAKDLAIKASESYIANLRDVIGDERFLHLLELYRGSALSIVIDKTTSMNDEIEVVRKEARLIVEKTQPELFVLVPYGDPDSGPVTKTTDANDFLQVIDDLKMEVGCCCLEEKFWHGLQLALINTPDYSTIYCFTDAGANDAEIMDGVIALASNKHCKVSIIYSYANNGGSQAQCPGYVVSGTEELKNLADITGGQFIEINQFDIDDISGFIEDGVDESKVGLRMREDVVNHQELSFPIDESIANFTVVINGVIDEATLTDGLGSWYDLKDKGGLNATDNVKVITHTDYLKSITFTSPAHCQWSMKLSAQTQYSVSVSAISTLGFLAEYTELELLPPRPSYVLIPGRPLTGQQYYVEISLVGYLESNVEKITFMEFVDKKGSVLSHVDYHGEVDDHIYIQSEALPGVPFYIQIDGYLEKGKPFSRISPTLAIPVESQIELLVESSVLYATPGQSTKAYFRVHNYGPEAQFKYTATDEAKYIYHWNPKTSIIPSMGTKDVEVDFRIPSLAAPGTTSTVTFTAASVLNPANVNTYITYYLVIDKNQDTVPPTCDSKDVPDCSGYNTESSCGDKSWTIVATLQDTLSGLNSVYSRPDGDLTLDGFTKSTTDPVTATFTASCCVRTLDVIGVDERGNLGRCQWDLGDLQVSTTPASFTTIPEITTTPTVITTPEVTTTTPEVTTTTTTTPEVTTATTTPEVITITTPEVTTTTTPEVITITTPEVTTTTTPEVTTTREVTIPTRAPTTTTDYTPSSVPPGWVVEFEAETVGETWVGLRWSVSESRGDFHKFSILINDDLAEDSRCNQLVCRLNITYLDSCTHQTFTLTPYFLTDEGKDIQGSTLFTDATTLGTVPGAPRNPSSDYTTDTSTTISWVQPANAACLDHYEVCFTMFGSTVAECVTATTNSYTMQDLEACTVYHVTITSISLWGGRSDQLKFDTNTNDAAPGAPENVHVINQTNTWVELSWNNPKDRANCVSKWRITYTKTDNKLQMLMTHTPDLLGDNFATIYDLVGCTNYTFQVSAVSAKDVQGSTRTTYASTEDADPTPVVSLTATAVDTNTVSAQWTPSVMEECVDHYHVCITDVDDLSKNCYDTTDHMKSFKNLEACGQYEITVKSVSPSGRLGGFIYDMAKTEDLPTSPPTDLEVSNVRPHSAVASFSPPLENPHCVHEYKANIIQLEDVSNLKHAELATSQSLVQTLAGLDACTNYGLWISAVTLSGYTSKQVNQNFTTGEEKPSAPRALSYTEIAQDYISLQWFMPQDNALCAEEYRLNWTSSTDSGHQDFTLPNHPVEVSVKVINLSSCTSYTFTVLAVTPLGVEGQTASLTVSTAC